MLSARSLKSRLRSSLVASPLRHWAAPVHRELTRLELAAARIGDRFSDSTSLSLEASRRVTAIIKTFERPEQLGRLLASLKRSFPLVPVIVADDGRQPGNYAGARTVALPFDSGVSAGRQAALREVDTEYTWVLDDDFVLYRRTGLARVLSALDAYPQIDIIGGPVIDLPFLSKQTAAHSPIYPTRARPILPLGSRVAGLIVRDKVPNFFVARSRRLRLVGWDPALKRLDHADFFTRARGVLVTAYDDDFRCLHAPTPFDSRYMGYRSDHLSDSAVLRQRYFDEISTPNTELASREAEHY